MLRHQPRPLRRVGVLVERHDPVPDEPVNVAERRVQCGAALLRCTSVAAEHHDVIAAIDEAIGARREIVERSEYPAEHPFADRLRTDVGTAAGQRAAFGFVPLGVGAMAPNSSDGSLFATAA